jgi:hypothetical protein
VVSDNEQREAREADRRSTTAQAGPRTLGTPVTTASGPSPIRGRMTGRTRQIAAVLASSRRRGRGRAAASALLRARTQDVADERLSRVFHSRRLGVTPETAPFARSSTDSRGGSALRSRPRRAGRFAGRAHSPYPSRRKAGISLSRGGGTQCRFRPPERAVSQRLHLSAVHGEPLAQRRSSCTRDRGRASSRAALPDRGAIPIHDPQCAATSRRAGAAPQH